VAQKNTVKHLNDWYHTKSDAIWQTFLEPLKKEAPEWKKYSEAFLDKMTWMQDLSTVKLGPSLWHMHPVMFLCSLIWQNKKIEIIRIRAFLRMIRIGEGTTTRDGYRTMFTGARFSDFRKHPNLKNKANGYVSTTAGAYQFLFVTWKDLQRKYSFKDFSPLNQDLGCIALIAGRKALSVVMQDNVSEAIDLCRIEWASLPGSPHGQPTVDRRTIIEKYEGYLLDEAEGKTTLYSSHEEVELFIKKNWPSIL
jgi:muramidase (phage lysozyme)